MNRLDTHRGHTRIQISDAFGLAHRLRATHVLHVAEAVLCARAQWSQRAQIVA